MSTRMWALVNRGGRIVVVKNRRDDCFKRAIQIFPHMSWEQIKRKFGVKVVRCTVELDQ